MEWQLSLKARDFALCLVRPKLTRGLIVYKLCIVPATPLAIRMICKVTLLSLFEFLELRVDVPILRSGLGRIK
eukprot:9300-Pelagomonas_calceolata.AAC.1